MIIKWLQLLFFCVVLLGCVPLLGGYMAKVFSGEKTILHWALAPLEKFSYWVARINPSEEMGWKKYAKSAFLFNFFGFTTLFFVLRIQHLLPLNPEEMGPLDWPLALNTAMSFVTNTNWQAYSGETTMSYFTQMFGLTTQNFLSAATGMGALLVLIRGFSRKFSMTIGNFWVDLVRSVIYLLLPLSIIFAIILVSQGVIQSLSPYLHVKTLENTPQVIPKGPVASQVAIKQLGTNGGGFFGANSAHPFENPNALTNFLESLAILLIPAALTYTFGSLIGSKKHGWLLFLAMFSLWAGGLAFSIYSESIPNPLLNVAPVLEGKESRFGTYHSLLWSVSTTATANGSTNLSLSSLSPLAGGVALFNILLGELIFGGVGVGLCNMICFALLTLFLSGLMVGRTPEYLGKKIEKVEIQWVCVAILVPIILILIFSSLATNFPMALAALGGNKGPHGLSEILYTVSSATANNGSTFAWLAEESGFYNKLLTLCMLFGRLSITLPSIAIGGSLAQKRKIPFSSGTLSTNSALFLFLLMGIIVVVGALTYFPALCLGPLMEHFLMLRGVAFS